MIAKKPTVPTNLSWLKQVPSSIALLDRNFCLIDASDQWYKKLAFAEKDVQGENLFELFPRLSDNWKTKLEYALDGLKDIQIIDKAHLSDGTLHNFIWYLNPWKDGYGNNIGVVLNVKDVTETKKLQLELNHTKNLLKEKGKIAKIGSWEYNVENEEVLLSPIVREIFNIEDDSKISLKNAMDFYKKGKSRERIQIAIHKAINQGTPWDENLELLSRNGNSIWVNTIGRPKFKDGKCARILGTIQDITEKAVSKEKKSVTTIEPKNDYQKFFESSPAGLVVTDYDTGKILEVNDSFVSIAGYDKKELIGKSYKGFNVFNSSTYKSTMLRQLASKGEFELANVDFSDKNGKKHIIQLSGKLILGSKKDKKIIATIKNISIPKRRTENLRKQVSDANENIEKLVNFTHMVSHNLKGHATNFGLLLNFLDKEHREDERIKLLTILKDGNENLTETIKGLREIVTIRTNTKLKKESLVMNDFIYRAEQRLTGLIKKEKAKIINEIEDDVKVKALPAYLENILVNCLSNAIKFRNVNKTPVIIISATSNKTHIVLSIEDNGIGMDLTKNKSRLFGLYETLGNNGESRGMGLYLTKYQVELMKGKIEVESTLGEGTTFKIFFPNK